MTPYWEKQMQHEGTKSYYESLLNILNMLWPEDASNISVLEIGTGWGISGSAFLDRGVGRFVTIDPNINAPYGKEAKAELKSKVKNTQLEFIEDRSEIYLPSLITKGEKFDLVYVDGDHAYEGFIRDLNFAAKLVKDGGKILLDDFLHSKNLPHPHDDRYGIFQGVREFLLHTQKQAVIFPTKTNGFLLI